MVLSSQASVTVFGGMKCYLFINKEMVSGLSVAFEHLWWAYIDLFVDVVPLGT